MKWIVVEIQTMANGAIGILTYDYTDRAAALSKYYTVLAAAAVTTLPSHGAILMTSDCRPVPGMNAVYHAEPQPEPAPEPEVEEPVGE